MRPVKRMSEMEMLARDLGYKSEERLKLQWLGGVREDLRKLGVKNW